MGPAQIRKVGDAAPEAKVVRDVITYLNQFGWYCKVLHGNTWQSGMPDLFCCHPRYGPRLIECKDPLRGGDLFTPAQKIEFPKLINHGCPVLIVDCINHHVYQFIIQNKSNYIEKLLLSNSGSRPGR